MQVQDLYKPFVGLPETVTKCSIDLSHDITIKQVSGTLRHFTNKNKRTRSGNNGNTGVSVGDLLFSPAYADPEPLHLHNNQIITNLRSDSAYPKRIALLTARLLSFKTKYFCNACSLEPSAAPISARNNKGVIVV